MAKTLDNLRDQVRMFLDEAGALDWTDGQVDMEINAGYQEVVSAVMETYEDFYLTTDMINTVADQQEYGSADGMNTDIFKLRRVELIYNTDTTDNYNRADYARLDEVARDLGNTASITPFSRPAYYIYGHGSSFKLGFIPIPNRSDTNAIKYWYIPYVADLVLAADTVNIPYPDRYAKAISWYAAGSLLSKGQQEEAAGSKYLGRFEVELAKMKQQLEDRAADGVKSVIDTAMQDVDFSNFGF